jgi:hypothetical protein
MNVIRKKERKCVLVHIIAAEGVSVVNALNIILPWINYLDVLLQKYQLPQKNHIIGILDISQI